MVWDAATGRENIKLRGHTGPVNGVAFSPDGTRLASACNDGRVKVWDLATGRELISLRSDAESVAFSPDGRRLSGTSPHWTVIWESSSVSPELLLQREAFGLVKSLFRTLVLKSKVIEHLRRDALLSGSLRIEALGLAERYPEAAIRDDAKLFDPWAVRQAKSLLERTEREHRIPILIETIESLPQGESIGEASLKRARASGFNGVYVLISKNDHTMEVRDYKSFLDENRRCAILVAFTSNFKTNGSNAGLVEGAKAIEKAVAEVGGRVSGAESLSPESALDR